MNKQYRYSYQLLEVLELPVSLDKQAFLILSLPKCNDSPVLAPCSQMCLGNGILSIQYPLNLQTACEFGYGWIRTVDVPSSDIAATYLAAT